MEYEPTDLTNSAMLWWASYVHLPFLATFPDCNITDLDANISRNGSLKSSRANEHNWVDAKLK